MHDFQTQSWASMMYLLGAFSYLGACIGGAGFGWLGRPASATGAVIGAVAYIGLAVFYVAVGH